MHSYRWATEMTFGRREACNRAAQKSEHFQAIQLPLAWRRVLLHLKLPCTSRNVGGSCWRNADVRVLQPSRLTCPHSLPCGGWWLLLTYGRLPQITLGVLYGMVVLFCEGSVLVC